MGIGEQNQIGSIDEDIACMSCRYNLRGLQRDGKCPECAQPVQDSLDEIRRQEFRLGSPLDRESRAWLISGAAGFFIYSASAPMQVAVALWPGQTSAPTKATLASIAIFALTQCLCVWLFTLRGNGEVIRTTRLRWCLRLLLVASTVILLGALIEYTRTGMPPTPILRVLQLAGYSSNAAATVVGFVYLGELAGRMRRTRLRSLSRFVSLFGAFMLAPILDVFVPLPWWLLRLFPDEPLLGPVVNGAHGFFFNQLPFDLMEWFVGILLPFAFVILSTGMLVWFGILFMRTASVAPRTLSANSIR